jgi:hypothetical protein
MSDRKGMPARRSLPADLSPTQRHDGSLEGYRRQRRVAVKDRASADAIAAPRVVPWRTQ